jgi:hypothetical protein
MQRLRHWRKKIAPSSNAPSPETMKGFASAALSGACLGERPAIRAWRAPVKSAPNDDWRGLGAKLCANARARVDISKTAKSLIICDVSNAAGP